MYSKLQIAGWVVLVIAVMWIVLWASARHDVMLMTAMQEYETCVQQTYHTTPAGWYEEHGELPQCDTTK